MEVKAQYKDKLCIKREKLMFYMLPQFYSMLKLNNITKQITVQNFIQIQATMSLKMREDKLNHF